MSKQTKYDWNNPDDSMKAEKVIQPYGSFHNVWNDPGSNTKPTISMKAEKRFYSSGRLHNDEDNPEDTMKMKDEMKV